MSAGRLAFVLASTIVLCMIGGLIADRQRAAIAATPGSVQDPPPTAQQVVAVSGKPTRTVTIVTPTPSPLPTVTVDRYADLHATETAIGLNQVQLDQAKQQLQLQILSDSATSTASALQTEAAILVGINTSAAGTQVAATAQAFSAQIAGTQTAIPLTATALVMTQSVEQTQLMVRQAQIVIWPILRLVAFIVFVVLAAALGWRWLQKKIDARYLQESQIKPDEKGRMPALPEGSIPGKSKRMMNLNLAHRAVTDPDHDDLTADQALANANNLRQLEATRAIADSPALLRRALKAQTETSMPQANVDISRPVLPLLENGQIVAPPWSLLERWDGKGAIPYGMSAHGLERVDLQNNPHLGIFGKTGQGKSRYFLRPFIACLLASGQRVVILGKSGDFWPFADHPNAKMITLRDMTDAGEAQRYADYLLRFVKEKNRRDEFLTSHRVSTWQEAGREITFLVLDELGNALDEMNAKSREEAHRWVNALVREGRKVGLYIALASQRAVGFKSIVEQMGRVAFYLADPEASRYAIGIPGAEQLPEGSGHFLAKFGRLNHCVSFSPTDEDLTHFLQARPVPQLEPINWIEGDVVESEPAMPQASDSSPIDTEEQQIRAILLRMAKDDNVSMRQVEREVWGRVRGGQYYEKVWKVWNDIKGATTTPPGVPESGAIAPL